MLNKEKISEIIASIRNSDPYIRTIYLNGGCYQFHLILKKIFEDSVPLISLQKNHVVTQIDGSCFDITGLVEGDFFYMTDAEIKMAERWSFAKNHALASGDCEFCGEPALITLPSN